MGFLAGTNVAMDLRVVGFAPKIRLSLFEKFFLVMKISFAVWKYSSRPRKTVYTRFGYGRRVPATLV